MKKTTLLFAGLLFCILAGAGCRQAKQPSTNEIPLDANPTSQDTTVPDFDIVTTTYTGSDELAISAIVEPGVTLQKTETGGTALVPTPTYTAAINEYAAARFQFANCNGNPGIMTIKKGTNFMLDNRDNKTHIFGIGPRTYELKAYEFALVNVQKIGDYFITCDGGGAAKVSIQE